MRSFRCVSLVLVLASASLASAQKYRVIDLGPGANYLSGSLVGNSPVAINESGVVLGNTYAVSGVASPFVWKNGARTDLGTFNGKSTVAAAINASGTVIGGRGDGFLWSNGSYQALPGWATAVNNAGVVALNTADKGAALYQNGVVTSLPQQTDDNGNPVHLGRVYDVNNLGQAIGSDYFSWDGYWRPAFWSNGVETEIRHIPYGFLGVATALNDTGLVVGYGSHTNGDFHTAFAWSIGATSTQMIVTPGYLFSEAYDVNDLGTAVGTAYSTTIPGYFGEAFVYREGKMTYLSGLLDPLSAGWTLSIATAINDRGQIVGLGILDGQYRAFLANPVPEPATIAALGLGVVAILRRRKRA